LNRLAAIQNQTVCDPKKGKQKPCLSLNGTLANKSVPVPSMRIKKGWPFGFVAFKQIPAKV
jgi:hypothetical protein